MRNENAKVYALTENDTRRRLNKLLTGAKQPPELRRDVWQTGLNIQDEFAQGFPDLFESPRSDFRRYNIWCQMKVGAPSLPFAGRSPYHYYGEAIPTRVD
jgi:hypothetical protein